MSGKVLDLGGLQMRPGSAAVTMDASHELDAKGEPWLEVRRWDCSVRLIKDYGGQTIDQQITALRAKLKTAIGYLHYNHPASEGGGIDVSRSVQSNEHIGGVRCIKPPSFLKYQRGDGSKAYSTVSFQLEAILPLYTSVFQVVSFKEDAPTVKPAGPVYEMLTPNVGPSVKQQVRTQDPSVYVQSGTIVHAGTYGPPPPPLFSNPMGPVQRQFMGARRIGSGAYQAHIAFEQRYTYVFSASSTINALPTKWN